MIPTESLVGLIFFCVFSILFVKNVVQDLTSAGIDWQREKWQSGLGSKFIHQGEKNAAKYADEVIVLSKGVQDYFKETYGRETHFIPNGVNRPEVREARLIKDHFGLEKDSYILFLGRLVPEKGIRYLVEAFKNVKTDKKLVIAGGSSDTDSFMEELKELAKGDDRILFTGFVQGAIVGSWIAEESLDKNEYSYLLVVVMALIWPLSKMIPTIRYSSSISLIASVFLGMSGVFILPFGFQRMPQGVKEKSLTFLRKMGGTLELYLTNIYVNDLLRQLNVRFPNDQYRIKYSICFTGLGVLLAIILIEGKKRIKRLYAK